MENEFEWRKDYATDSIGCKKLTSRHVVLCIHQKKDGTLCFGKHHYESAPMKEEAKK